jgi:hypothetical protein
MDRKKFLQASFVVATLPFLPKGWLLAPPPAFKQGSGPLKPILNTGIDLLDSSQRVIEIGFANAIMGYEHLYPTLAKAVENMSPAKSTIVIWDDQGNDVEWWKHRPRPYEPYDAGVYVDRLIRKSKGKYNYQQIIRTPFGMTNTEMSSTRYGPVSPIVQLRRSALHQHLGDVENTLRFGKRSRKVARPWSSCGGVECFGAGRLALRPIRDLVLITNRQANDEDHYTEEFLSEFTLQVS